MDLSLDDAIQRGVKNNLGAILSGTQTAAAKAQRLSQLQPLLPDVEFNAREAEMQVDLAAQGLRIPGFPTIIGPFGYTDLRASLSWSLLDLKALRTYMAAKHQFKAAELSAQDARDMVVLTAGNAYMLVLADEGRVSSFQAQVATAKISLDQANASHEAGTAPKLDVLRAQVDYQSLQQQLIVAQNSLEKDKLALARVIGLPLDQKFNLSDKAPYAVFRSFRCGRDYQAGACESQGPSRHGGADQGGRGAAEGRHGGSIPDGEGGCRLWRYRCKRSAFAWNRQCARHIECAGIQGICTTRRG